MSNMPAISTCPRCQQQVSIPQQVESAAQVRCPLCHAEYPLSESLVLARRADSLVLTAFVEEEEPAAEPAATEETAEDAADERMSRKMLQSIRKRRPWSISFPQCHIPPGGAIGGQKRRCRR